MVKRKTWLKFKSTVLLLLKYKFVILIKIINILENILKNKDFRLFSKF